jgi:hypothetical protein
MEDSRNSI